MTEVLPRFVVGTGRCGSTLLSLMLAQHRDVVSLHEFFTGLDWSRRFADGSVSGDDLADLIGAEQPVTTAVLARGYISDEIQYPFGSSRARHTVADPVPWLLVTMLSRLTGDPDRWYDDMIAFARSRPPASMAEHYVELFDWVTRRAGGKVWIERSGSSIDYLGDLARLWPRARFVHIHRDGHEAALSIRDHRFFRLGVSLFMDLFPDVDDPEDAITQGIDTPPPCWAVGRYWSDQVLRGFAALPGLDRDQFHQVRFEDLILEPRRVLGEIATFFELGDDPQFVGRAATLVRDEPAPRFDRLDRAEQDELREACRAGQLLLGRAVP
jgi:putative sulfotransferase